MLRSERNILKEKNHVIFFRIRRLWIILLMIISSLSANAQYSHATVIDSTNLSSLYLTTNISAIDTVSIDTVAIDTVYYEDIQYTKNNWFISITGGFADLESEQTDYVSFKDRIRPTIGISFGKWVNPVVAVRLNFTAAKLQGYVVWNDVTNMGVGNWYFGKNHRYNNARHDYVPADVDGTTGAEIKKRYFGKKLDTNGYQGYIYEVPYAGGSFDGVFNLSNLFSHYNPKRLLDIYAYAGVGFTHTFGDLSRDQTDINSVMGKTGVSFNFRLSDHVGLFLEQQTIVVPEFFDWRVGDGNTMDLIFNYSAGITFNLGATSKKVIQRPEIKEIIEQINITQAPKPESKPEKEKLYIAVHFAIDKHNVQPSEMYKLDRIADYMYQYPDSKIAISGYADVQTAYPSYNQKLSERRVNEVVRLLHERYGISMSRLAIKAFGDKVQPFYENNLNRAVIAFDIE